MHSSRPPCIRDLGEVQVDCMLNEAPDIRPMERKSGVRAQMRSSTARIEFQAASKAVARLQKLVKMAWYCMPKS